MERKRYKKVIILLDIESIELHSISRLLMQGGYNALHFTLAEFKKHCFIDISHLIIVDTLHHGIEVIGNVKNDLTACLNDKQISLPPILALVDAVLRYKQPIFQLGALDYLSCPLITEEFTYRIEQAIHSVDLLQANCIHNPEKVTQALEELNGPSPDIAQQYQSDSADYVLAKKTAHYLKSQLANEINLNDLARNMATNRNKLSRSFRAYFGATVFDWLREQRMICAVELLGETTQTILQIAEQVGYPDSNNFSTAFKRTYSLSPMQYRKMQQTKNVVQGAKVMHQSVQVDLSLVNH